MVMMIKNEINFETIFQIKQLREEPGKLELQKSYYLEHWKSYMEQANSSTTITNTSKLIHNSNQHKLSTNSSKR